MATVQEALEDIDFDLELEDDEVVSDAIVVMRVVSLADGRRSVGFARSSNADMVIVNGLLDCGREINHAEWDEA